MTDNEKLRIDCEAEMNAALAPFVGRADFGPAMTKEICDVLVPIIVKYRMKGLQPHIDNFLRSFGAVR
jgi:hypothetical protein